jgi:hypothetical protein
VSFKPPYSQDPGRIVTPAPLIRVIIQASDKWFASVGDAKQRIAEEIIARNGGAIRQFYLAQIQGYRAGSVGVQTTHLRLKEIDLMLQVVQGSVILTVTVKPENAQQKSEGGADVNLDGYIAWVCLDHDPPGPHDPPLMPECSFTFILNGTPLYDFSFTPTAGAVIFRFGVTALLCHSLADNENPDIAKLVHQLLPERAKITVPVEHRDIPAYFIYDPGTAQNGDAFGQPPIIKDLQFDLSDGLVPEGRNEFRVNVQPTLPFRSTWTQRFHIFGEFYARKMVDKVKQSWKFSHSSADIAVNDKPLYWSMDTGPFPVQAMDIDLTPKNTPDTTVLTPANQGSAFPHPTSSTESWAGTPRYLWRDQSKGYYRIGDPASGQLQPPFGLWKLALDAAQRVVVASADLINWSKTWVLAGDVTHGRVTINHGPGGMFEYVSGTPPEISDPSDPLFIVWAPGTVQSSVADSSPFGPTLKQIANADIYPDLGGIALGTVHDTMKGQWGYVPGTYTYVGTYGIGADDLPDYATITDVINTNYPASVVASYQQRAVEAIKDAYHNYIAIQTKDDDISVYAADGGALTSIQQSLDIMVQIRAIVHDMLPGFNYNFFQSDLIVDQQYPGGSSSPPLYTELYNSNTNITALQSTASGHVEEDPFNHSLDDEIKLCYDDVLTIQANAQLLMTAIQGFDLQPV